MTHTTKHTPGPLEAVQIIIESSPCTWAVQRKNIREQWGKPSIATYIDNEADARLFAAAPAMYEALKALHSVLDQRMPDGRTLNQHLSQEVFECFYGPAIAARAAIAKAEGA